MARRLGTRGLYPDGWSRPGRVAHIKVFPDAAQRGPALRSLTVSLRAPEGTSRPTTFASNAGRWPVTVGADTVQQTVSVCVPRKAPAEVSMDVRGASPVPGDPSTIETFAQPRQAGVLLGSISLASELGASLRTQSLNSASSSRSESGDRSSGVRAPVTRIVWRICSR